MGSGDEDGEDGKGERKVKRTEGGGGEGGGGGRGGGGVVGRRGGWAEAANLTSEISVAVHFLSPYVCGHASESDVVM